MDISIGLIDFVIDTVIIAIQDVYRYLGIKVCISMAKEKLLTP
jgi:hypothetical protein